jgi:hypothetical protein
MVPGNKDPAGSTLLRSGSKLTATLGIDGQGPVNLGQGEWRLASD